jgi:hypothetical protein
MERQLDSNRTVAVLEIGAGFNTPTVTRWPVESFVRDLGLRGRLIRINPSDSQVPTDINAVGIYKGWKVLDDIKTKSAGSDEDVATVLVDQMADGLAVD